MVIAQYSDLYWYPSGALATNVAARVFPAHSNAFAPLWADAGGTIPLANPTSTDGTGTLEFFAEEGDYWVHIDSESFLITVGVPPDLSVAEVASATISTGIVSGGAISVNAGSSSAIDIEPLVGYITDFTADPFNPTVTRINFPGVVGLEMDAGSLARTVTSWLMDENQVITQVPSPTSNEQRRTHIRIGLTAQFGGVISVDQSLPIILQQPANQLSDLMVSLGPFNISGNRISANGANLMINQTAGKLFSQAFNHYVGPVQTNDPHVTVTQAQTPAQFRYVTSTSTTFGAVRNTIDVANYAPGGVVTPVGGGAGTSTVHRVYMFPANNAVDQIVIQYGSNTYPNLAAAAAAVGGGMFTPNSMLADAAFIGYVVATRTATNLSDPAQASITNSGKFATP